ncbi:unnamed protein product, partial [Candidula unifasciata]
VGEKLGRMDVEKRQAVENEDYDQARLKKQQIDEYRLQIYKDLNLNDLLELPGNRHPRPINLEPIPRPISPPVKDLPRTPPRYEERTLPLRTFPVIDEFPPEADLNQEAETMSEGDLREASTAIDVFGLALVSKAYSKTWSYREDALTSVYRQMQEMPSANKEESKSVLRAAIFLVKRGIDDKVYAVFKAALALLRMILTDFVARHKVGKADISSAVETSLSNLFHKAGDTAVRNREDAKSFALEMATFPEVKQTQTVPHEFVKPFKMTLAPRHAQSRCELVEALYQKFGLKNGLTLDNVMTFNIQALQHNAGEVRDVAERLIKQMYRDHGAPVKDYLPPDDEKTRKNTLWRQLFEYFDEVDGKPSKTELKKLKAGEELKKQAEIEDLQKQLQQLREINAGKHARGKDGRQKKADMKPKSKAKNAKDDDDLSVFTVDNTCIFCGEKNESFTEEGLDLHYWKNCPMLKRCANCKQVVEIATYTDHILTECETKSNFSKCPRCTEAIARSEFDQHVADKACSAAKPGLNHCPLCHENIPSGEDGWKEHLMSKTGCKQNPRRLLAVNKPAAGTLAISHLTTPMSSGGLYRKQ